MAKRLQLRGGTTAQHSTFTGAVREVTVDTDKDTLVVHDGATAGGIPLAKSSELSSINTDLVNDTTPQLGGDLDLNSSDITGTGNVNVTGTVTATSFSGDGSGLSGVTSVGGATGVDFNDDVKARFGTDNDLEIFHSGATNIINSNTTNQDIVFKGNDGGTPITVLTLDMSAGGEATFGNNIRVDDNSKIMAGTGNDLQISHDGSNSIINAAGTGGLLLQNNTDNQIVSIQSDDGAGGLTDYVKADGGNGEVLLYHYGSEKLKTQSDGLDVTGNIIPASNDTYDLGSASFVWRNIYTGDLHLSNEAKSEGNSVDGTKGNWTIQEGAEDLFIVNNKSGKKYKFKLEEI